MNKQEGGKMNRREFLGALSKGVEALVTSYALSRLSLIHATEQPSSLQKNEGIVYNKEYLYNPNHQEGQQNIRVREKIEKIIGKGRPHIITSYSSLSSTKDLKGILFGSLLDYGTGATNHIFTIQETTEDSNGTFTPYETIGSINDKFNMRGVAKIGNDSYLLTGIYYPNPYYSSILVSLFRKNGQIIYQAELPREQNYDNTILASNKIADVSLNGVDYYFLPVDNRVGLPVLLVENNISRALTINVQNPGRMSFEGLKAITNGNNIDVFVTGFEGFYGIRIDPNNLQTATTKITSIKLSDFDLINRDLYGVYEPTKKIITGQLDNDNSLINIKRYSLPFDIYRYDISGIVALDNNRIAVCSSAPAYNNQRFEGIQVLVDFYEINNNRLNLNGSIPIGDITSAEGLGGISGVKMNIVKISDQQLILVSTPHNGVYIVSSDPNSNFQYPINGAGLGGHKRYLPTVRRIS